MPDRLLYRSTYRLTRFARIRPGPLHRGSVHSDQRMAMQPRRRAPAARWFAMGALVLLAAGCAPQSVTEEGQAVYNLYNLFLYIAAVVFLVVSALVIWSVIRYRRRGDDLPKQVHGNNRLELTWTLIPTVIVLALFGFTLAAQERVLDDSGEPDLNVTVTAFQ